MLKKVLVANRGEIAVRILRALDVLGIPGVAVFSEVDEGAQHVRLADEAYCIGPAPPLQSYLRTDRILAAAKEAGADGIHPGYGFLAENAAFAAEVRDAGLTFIGPSADAIAVMGDKLRARQAAIDASVPVLPGMDLETGDEAELKDAARAIGFPLLLKAVGGGGGKGMRIVREEEELASAYRTARNEAEKAFNNPKIYIERYLDRAHHVEIQVVGDEHGAVIHLGERECSVQRRHQKIIEESPSPLVDPDLRERMGAAGVDLCRRIGYASLGTVEYLLDPAGEFYFLEMNTRLQVEHPVTELVTGLDLVALQVRLAGGETLPLTQDQVTTDGHAIEVRLCAEDPYRNFVPSIGRIDALELPHGPHVRVDSGILAGQEISLFYDPMIAKLLVWGEDRDVAIARMRSALSELRVTGVKTTGPLTHEILDHPVFRAGEWHTAYLEAWIDGKFAGSADPPRPAGALGEDEPEAVAVIAAVLRHIREQNPAGAVQAPTEPVCSPWVLEARREGLGNGC